MATDIRCHVVIFTFAALDDGYLNMLTQSLQQLRFDQQRVGPDCLKDYAIARTIRHRVEPVAVEPQFVTVPARIVIGEDGRVEHVHVIRASPAQQRSIEDALSQWRFAPYLKSGLPNAVETGLTFDFKPQHPSD